MTYRVYLRDDSQRVTTKTATDSKAAALAAFGELVNRTDLDGQKFLAVLNQDGKKIAHHNFMSRAGDYDYWRCKLDKINM